MNGSCLCACICTQGRIHVSIRVISHETRHQYTYPGRRARKQGSKCTNNAGFKISFKKWGVFWLKKAEPHCFSPPWNQTQRQVMSNISTRCPASQTHKSSLWSLVSGRWHKETLWVINAVVSGCKRQKAFRLTPKTNLSNSFRRAWMAFSALSVCPFSFNREYLNLIERLHEPAKNTDGTFSLAPKLCRSSWWWWLKCTNTHTHTHTRSNTVSW